MRLRLAVSARNGTLAVTRDVTRVVNGTRRVRYDVLTMRPDGTGIRPTTKLVREQRSSASWSPNGRAIAFDDATGCA